MAESLFQGTSLYKTPAQIIAERRQKYASALSSMSGAERAGAGIGALFSGFLPDSQMKKATEIDKLFAETQQEFAGAPQEADIVGAQGEKIPGTGKPFSEMTQFEQDNALLQDTAEMYSAFSEKLSAIGYASEAEAAKNQALEYRLKAYELMKAKADIESEQALTGYRQAQAKDTENLPQMTGESRRQISALIKADDELETIIGMEGTMAERILKTTGEFFGVSEGPTPAIMNRQQLIQAIFAKSQLDNISLEEAAEMLKQELLLGPQ